MMIMDMSPAERCRHIRERLTEDGVYNQWLVSYEPFWIEEKQFSFLESLGSHLHSFYKASNKLFYESIHGRQPAWIAGYLNHGKPQSLIDYACMNRMKGLLPGVIRPDIILTEDGMTATELDSVPGGIGITGSLNRTYSDYGYSVAGGKDGIAEGFIRMVSSSAQTRNPVIAIVVSEESRDYRPEMEWLAGAIRESGGRAFTIRPQDVTFTEDGLFVDSAFSGETQGHLRIDVLYRFFELFDLKNIPKSDLIMYSAKKKDVAVTPPFKPFLEEKMLYALFHHPLLETYWVHELGEEVFDILSKLFPRTWVLDPADMPPYGIIPGLRIGNKKVVSRWTDLADATQKERQFVIKPSGFSELAWGSRGVTVGDDVSKEEWSAAIEGALKGFYSTPYILQEFHKGRHVEIKYLGEGAANIATMTGRVRLCPYYFVEGEDVKLRGIMATICPLDKKLIHGMKDAVITAVGISN
jgi:hypothetical protein